MSMLALVPNIEVVIEGSEEITSPLRNQVIFKGSSPRLTRQVSCATSPSLITSVPKENGTICGVSVKVYQDYKSNSLIKTKMLSSAFL